MTRALAIALLVIAVLGCKERRSRLAVDDAAPAPPPVTLADELTPEQRARLDSLVEGTSPHVSCNELLRLMRRFATCPGVPPDMRAQMVQAVLALADLIETSDGATDTTCAEGIRLWDASVTSLGC